MWSAEQLEVRDLAREFAEGELRPRSADWDERRELDSDALEGLAELGFLGVRVPEEHGGLGLDPGTFLLTIEELARGDPAVALAAAIHAGPVTELVSRHGSRRQKERFLPALASGERLGAFALAERAAGGELGALGTCATPDGEGWLLRGSKAWVTNGDRADLILVVARVEREEPPDTDGREADEDGVGIFLVDRDADGYRVVGRERTSGLRASETVEIRLDEVRVGSDRLLGRPGEGGRYVGTGLDVARMSVAAVAVGIARSALEHATRYAADRAQFGHPIGDFGGIQEKLAEMAGEVVRARAIVHEASRRIDPSADPEAGPSAGVGRSAACALAKLAATAAADRVAREGVQIYGGYGYMRDYPVEKLMRDAKGMEVLFGPSAALRRLVARDLLLPHRKG